MYQQFVRGSQISFHNLRMFFQSLKHICALSLVFFIIVAAFYIYQNSVLYLFRPEIFLKYLIAEIHHFLNLEKIVTFTGVSGKVISIPTSNYIIWYKSQILSKLIFLGKSAFFLGLKWFIVSFIFITLFFIYQGKKQKQHKHLRGMQLVRASSLRRKINLFNIKKLCFFPYQIGNFSYPYEAEYKHTLIVGSTGSGKTVMMMDLIDQIRARGDRAVIYDALGSFIRKFYDPKKDIILNPCDSRSKHWSFFSEGTTRNVFDNMTNILIEDSKDPFWAIAARTLIVEVACKLVSQNNYSNKSLCDHLLKLSTEDFFEFLKETDASAIASPESEKTIAGIRSLISTYIKSIRLLEDHQEYFSIKDWIRDPSKKDSILFLSSQEDYKDTITPLLTLWLDLAVLQLLTLDQEQNRTIWFIIDEMPTLKKLPTIKSGLARTRQFGGAFVISCQSISQFQEIYGIAGAQTISGCCRNQITFATPDKPTAVWCAENLGNKEMLNTKENISFGASQMRDGVSIHEAKEMEQLVLPSEIMNLKNLEFYIKLDSGFPIAKAKMKYHSRADIASKLEEKPIIYNNSVIDSKLKAQKNSKKNKDKKFLKKDKQAISLEEFSEYHNEISTPVITVKAKPKKKTFSLEEFDQIRNHDHPEFLNNSFPNDSPNPNDLISEDEEVIFLEGDEANEEELLPDKDDDVFDEQEILLQDQIKDQINNDSNLDEGRNKQTKRRNFED